MYIHNVGNAHMYNTAINISTHICDCINACRMPCAERHVSSVEGRVAHRAHSCRTPCTMRLFGARAQVAAYMCRAAADPLRAGRVTDKGLCKRRRPLSKV